MKIITVSELGWWRKKPRPTPYLTVFVRIEPPLTTELCGIRDVLRRVDRRQIYSPSSYLHVTVKELGWLGDDIKPESLPGILEAVGQAASNQAPFELVVDGLGIFPTVIYGKVGRGANAVRGMNAQLVERPGGRVVQSKYDGKRMVPHVTLAHFATSDVEPLLAKATPMASRRIGKMKVTEIRIGKWFPRRLFEEPRRHASSAEVLARFKLSHP